jgi:hypothetical protein
MQSDLGDSLVSLDTVPIPKVMFDIFDVPAYKVRRGLRSVKSEEEEKKKKEARWGGVKKIDIIFEVD